MLLGLLLRLPPTPEKPRCLASKQKLAAKDHPQKNKLICRVGFGGEKLFGIVFSYPHKILLSWLFPILKYDPKNRWGSVIDQKMPKHEITVCGQLL